MAAYNPDDPLIEDDEDDIDTTDYGRVHKERDERVADERPAKLRRAREHRKNAKRNPRGRT